jgi:hypothetical protein
MRRVLVTGVIAVVGVALAVAPAGAMGKSSSGGEAAKSPRAILADAKAATSRPSSVAISGTVTTGGQQISLNIVSAHGAGGGTISLGDEKFNIVVARPNLYLKADAATWNKAGGTSGVGQLLADKWIRTTTSNQDFENLAVLVDVSELTHQISSTGTITKGAVTTFRGKRAIPLRNTSSSGDGGGTLYVAATGSPYILAIVGPSGKGQLLFGQYGSAKVPKAPKQSVDLSQLQLQTATTSSS